MNRCMIVLLIKITAAQNEAALSYHSVLGLYFLAVVFAAAYAYDSKCSMRSVAC